MDNTPRIRHIAEAMKDEGIVQPVTKVMEQLSPRLHQLRILPGEIRGAFLHCSGARSRMIQNRRTASLAPEVAAYIAGLVDGEGTITLTRLHANHNRRLVVSIANTELPILQFVIDKVGAGKITHKRIASDLHTPSFCYALASTQALDLLRQIEPYLHSYKRGRARLALEQYKVVTPRNGKYTVELAAARREFETSFLALTAKPEELHRA